VICELCRLEPRTADGCIPHTIYAEGLKFAPIRYGDDHEGWKRFRLEPPPHCHYCHVKLGECHHPGCQLERCPVCAAGLRNVNAAREALGQAPALSADDGTMQAMDCWHCRTRTPNYQAYNPPASTRPDLAEAATRSWWRTIRDWFRQGSPPQ
jgi:hypothetical protein